MMKGLINAAWRWLGARERPTNEENLRRLRERGESLSDFRWRDATPRDIPALAELHVVTWNATYGPMGAVSPSVHVREQQWRDGFQRADPEWFCMVLERADGALVGFAQVNRSDHPGYAAELRRLHLLRDYQRLGFGTRALGLIARRLLARGFESMWLSGDARNPSIAAWISLGAHKTDANPGTGNYAWSDLRALLARCTKAGYDEPA
jgi:RimJ/RimL family protein N-acetyltransferase